MPSKFKTLLFFWKNLDRKRRLQIILLGILMLISGVAEIISIGLLVPFLAILVSPDKILNYDIVNTVIKYVGISSETDLIIALTISFCASALVAGIIRLTVLWFNLYITQMVSCDIENTAFSHVIHRPYQQYILKNSGDILSAMEKVKRVGRSFLSAINIFNGSVISIMIVTTLIIIDPQVALTAMLALGFFYATISLVSKKMLSQNGIKIAEVNSKRYRVIQEALGAMRDILLDKTQSHYQQKLGENNYQLYYLNAVSQFTDQSAKILVEVIAMILIALIAFSLSADEGFLEAVPVLGALALGGQRLMPSLQQIYAGWVNLETFHPSLLDVAKEMPKIIDKEALHTNDTDKTKLPFSQALTFHDVWYRYHDQAPWTLKNFNLTIPCGKKIGIIGHTGAGKSTVIDLFMGLLTPQKGEIKVDGSPLCQAKLKAWQYNIAHVPQDIYLADMSLGENIAFATPSKKYNKALAVQSADKAQILQFINNTKNGLETNAGERGIKLSGGQKQRLGLARALYKQTPILVLDEATSALDIETENKIIQSISEMDDNMTLLIISHRYSILKQCDLIYELKPGGQIDIVDKSKLQS